MMDVDKSHLLVRRQSVVEGRKSFHVNNNALVVGGSSSLLQNGAIGATCTCQSSLTICSVCKAYPKPEVMPRRGGTLGFRPPEVMMRCHDQTTGLDIWASGVIMLSFITGRYPFIKADDDLEVLHAFTFLIGTNRMLNAASELGKTMLLDPKPVEENNQLYGFKYLRSRCINIRINEKRFFPKPGNPNGEKAKISADDIKLNGSHVFSNNTYSFLSTLLDPNPKTRTTAYSALKHPYFSTRVKPS